MAFLAAIPGMVGSAAGAVGGAIGSAAGAVGSAASAIGSAVGGMGTTVGGWMGGLGQGLSQAGGWIGNALQGSGMLGGGQGGWMGALKQFGPMLMSGGGGGGNYYGPMGGMGMPLSPYMGGNPMMAMNPMMGMMGGQNPFGMIRQAMDPIGMMLGQTKWGSEGGGKWIRALTGMGPNLVMDASGMNLMNKMMTGQHIGWRDIPLVGGLIGGIADLF